MVDDGCGLLLLVLIVSTKNMGVAVGIVGAAFTIKDQFDPSATPRA